MRIMVVPTGQIAQVVGDMFAGQLEKKTNSVLGMTTGSTPLTLGIYREWIERAEAGEMNFSEAIFVNPDELYGLPRGHVETYREYMQEHLFKALQIPEERTHIPDSNPENVEAECQRFDQLLRKLGGVDLQLMGLGLNGHIAFIEPANALSYSTYLVELAEEDRPQSEHFSGESPTHAITVGIGSVLRSKSIIIVATGQKKAEIVEKAFAGSITAEVPASFLQMHKAVTVILDEESAARIPANMYERIDLAN